MATQSSTGKPDKLEMKLLTSPDRGLLFRMMSGVEEMSRLFEYQILAVSRFDSRDAKANVAPKDMLGRPLTVEVETGPNRSRWFHGLVASFGLDGDDVDGNLYRITMRPWAWLMTRSADVRIFQEMSALEIIKQIFGKYSAAAFADETKASYKKRTYCVQYRETDFEFVSRLLEEEGIFYYWRHSKDAHHLVLADNATTHAVAPGFDKISFVGGASPRTAALATARVISQWHERHEIQTGEVTLSDYDFQNPGTSLKTKTAKSAREHAEKSHEVYDYPGLHGTKADGDARSEIRLDEASAQYARFTGMGDTPGLVVGTRFKLDGHWSKDQNAEYIVLRAQTNFKLASYRSGDAERSDFICEFVAVPASEAFRPERVTRKPAVAGPQTAVVVGGGGDGDIETDKHGRVKVQFHWDRLGKKDASSSCWLRVATSWAGNGWGMISLPRIGQEVVVAFLEGDPDQPLVVGSVYNETQKPPYELPANATVSTLKSRSKKGAAADFNELRFEDKPGSEYVLLHAQKDLHEFVENTAWSEIGKDEHRTVKNNRVEKIEGAQHLQVAKGVSHKIGGELSTTVAKDMLFETSGQHSLKAAMDITAESGTAYSISAGSDMHVKVGMNLGIDSGMNVHIKGGMNVVIEAGVMMTLKGGAGTIVLGPDGVSITGPLVKINSGGGPGSGAGASPVKPTAPKAPKAAEPPKDPLTHR